MSRIVELPYVYQITGTLRGKRNASSVWVRDSLPVEIRAVHPDDAPLALKIRNNSFKAEFRAFERRPLVRFMGPSTDDGQINDIRELTLDNLDRELAKIGPENVMRWAHYPIDLFQTDDYRNPKRLKFRHEHAFRSIDHDGRDEARALIASKLKRLVSIDGALWREAPEWTWQVEIGARKSSHSNLFVRDEPRGERITKHAFRLDEADKARAFHERVCAKNHRRPMGDASVDDLGLIDWRFDSAVHGAELAAVNVFERMKTQALALMPEEFFGPFCRLRKIALAEVVSRTQASTVLEDLKALQEAALAAPADARTEAVEDLLWDIDNSIWRLENLHPELHAAPDLTLEDEGALASLGPNP